MLRLHPTIVAGALLLGLLRADVTAAQTLSAGRCDAGDLREFTIRNARLEDPFWMLRLRRPTAATLAAIDRLRGQRYAFDTVNAVAKQIESDTFRPARAESLVRIDYADIGTVDCQDRQLDVVFRTFSAEVSRNLSALFEWGANDKAPNETAGVAQPNAAWQFAPEARFDRALGFAAGARAKATWSGGHLPFGSLDVDAIGSNESHLVSASLVGGYDSATSWLRRASWRVAFLDSSAPAGGVHLEDRNGSAQFFVASRPLKGLVARFGGALDGGRTHSGFAPDQLTPQIVANSDVTSAKLFGGVTARGGRQSFAASYALFLGSTAGGFHGDWRKQIGDATHELWLPFRDHRLFEVEQRLTFGVLQTITALPAAERFFAGAGNDSFLIGDDWRLRTGPVIRSIPTNQFSLSGIGGDRFAAYASTTAFTVWGKPVVPKELLDDQGFGRKLQGQLVSARNALDIVYRSEDPSFRSIKDRLPAVVATLQRIGDAKAVAQSTAPLPPEAFEPCEDALHASRSAADHALADKPVQSYGWVKEMLPDGDFALDEVVSSCGVDLIAALNGVGASVSQLASASTDLTAQVSALREQFAAIDNRRSAERAGHDMAYAERALTIITRQMNITSISPVFIFDVAHIGPAGDDPYSGYRYAVGGGLRFTLASTVSFTATYAVNPRRRPGEGSGALVFSLTTRNLFE